MAGVTCAHCRVVAPPGQAVYTTSAVSRARAGYRVRVHRRTHTRTHSHASFRAQSRRPWSHALQLTNTELIISALSAARSVGCGWANQSSQWIGLSGVIAAPAQGLQLGTAPTLKEAQEQCDAHAQCYLVFADLRGNARWRSASFGVGFGVSRGWASVARACRLGFDEAEHDG